jgi:hypothetical protein
LGVQEIQRDGYGRLPNGLLHDETYDKVIVLTQKANINIITPAAYNWLVDNNKCLVLHVISGFTTIVKIKTLDANRPLRFVAENIDLKSSALIYSLDKMGVMTQMTFMTDGWEDTPASNMVIKPGDVIKLEYYF